MNIKNSLYNICYAKIIFPFSLLFLIISFFSPIAILEASACGKTEETVQRKGILWNGVYCDLDNLSFNAMIPNYEGASLEGSNVMLRGRINDETGYFIAIAPLSFPMNVEQLVKCFKEADPNSVITIVKSTISGIKCGIDLASITPDKRTIFFRVLVAENYLIVMSSTDLDIANRQYFFESLYLQ